MRAGIDVAACDRCGAVALQRAVEREATDLIRVNVGLYAMRILPVTGNGASGGYECQV